MACFDTISTTSKQHATQFSRVNLKLCIRFQPLTAVTMRNDVFRNLTSFSLVMFTDVSDERAEINFVGHKLKTWQRRYVCNR
jgi:hypothetical protein